ncbi:MAG TPA: EamA family transporter [Opitutaceae bacterium]|nr:EamA family transporter [Opitutaceae bacterium]
MALLVLVSFVWAFSFGLIKGRLAGVDPTAVATLRLALALLVFVPFMRPRAVARPLQLRLAAIGAIQFGLMYVLYLRSFAHLEAFEVALFTITTPLFVALLDAAVEKQFVLRHAVAAALAVAGAAVVLWQRVASDNAITGIVLVQISNLCFAAGQIAWRRVRARAPASIPSGNLFGFVYAGAFAVSLVWSLVATDWSSVRLTAPQMATVVYLGILASGLCFFWWNLGATQVNAGALAVFNNVKIPLAIACSLLFFGEHANLPRLLAGGALMAVGVWASEWRSDQRRADTP